MISSTSLRIDDLRAGFADPPPGTAPMMRWWWFGPSVTRPELERQLEAMADAGISGVEVAYVYPLGSATTEFGSAQFLSDLRFAADRAHELGLRFDLTLGSGWSFGGPHISNELAARQLHWERREIGPAPLDIPLYPAWPGEGLVAAFLGAGSLQELSTTYQPLPFADGRLRIDAGSGPRVVLLAYARLTGQNVKRAAVGAEGPVLDHYSALATEAHLQAVGDPMLDAIPAELIGSVFCDSLEVYGADWTALLPEEFARRRGYDLLPKLHLLVVDEPGSVQLRADYHRTLAELYEENFVAVCRRWSAGRGVLFRIQSYGTPPATISSYRYADLFEGEGWGWNEITQTRWAASAAHLYGRPEVSAEAWTWVHSPSFRATPLDLKGEAHEHLLNGVNQLIGHGWPYSPAGSPGLGWFFYAAGALDDRNPWWPAMPELTRYLSRLCWLLRQGAAVADVAVYVPNEDLFAAMGRAQGGTLDTWREARRRIPGSIPATIRAAGLDFDLIDDDALGVTDPGRYPVVVVPVGSSVPAATTHWFDRVRAASGRVLTEVTSDSLSDALLATVRPDLAISPPSSSIGYVHRREDEAEIYLVVNTGPAIQTFAVTPRPDRASYEQWDAMTGQPLRAGAVLEGIELTLQPYEATVLVLSDEASTQITVETADERRLPLSDGWRVAYGDQPAQPVDLPHVWEDEPGRRHYSGSATYTTTVDIGDVPGQVSLDLGACDVLADDAAEHDLVGPSYRVGVRGPVGEIAHVRVNGIDCGLAWAPPYRVDVTEALHNGANRIEITVSNTAANALATDEHITQLAAESEARYGRRFRMQDLDQAMATVRSGLLQVPTLVVSRP